MNLLHPNQEVNTAVIDAAQTPPTAPRGIEKLDDMSGIVSVTACSSD